MVRPLQRSLILLDFKPSNPVDILQAFFITPDGVELDSSSNAEVEQMKAKLGLNNFSQDEKDEANDNNEQNMISTPSLHENSANTEDTHFEGSKEGAEDDLHDIILSIFLECSEGSKVAPALVCFTSVSFSHSVSLLCNWKRCCTSIHHRHLISSSV